MFPVITKTLFSHRSCSTQRLLLLNHRSSITIQSQHPQPQQHHSARYLSSSSSSWSNMTGVSDQIGSSIQSLQGVHFMSIDQLSTLTDCILIKQSKSELQGLLDLSMHYKKLYSDKSNTPSLPRPLLGRSVSMIFQKRSTRTRVSTETGMSLLGGHALFLGPTDIQLGVNESMRDTSNVLSRFNDLILARVFGHADVVELSKYSHVPVINALSDLHHPLQTLADLMTLQEHFGSAQALIQKTVAWVGDGNNVLHDLALGSAILGMNVNIATPVGYEMNSTILHRTKELAAQHGGIVTTTNIATEAVKGAHCVVTDTWVSMGQEEEYAQRVAEFDGYQVNTTLMSHADPTAVFLHCLPRHQEEVSDDVFYHPTQSLVFPEAENRMWTVMAVMAAQLGQI